MVAILQWQKFNEGIPARLPKGTPVAHQTGEITKIHHDTAIVFAKRPSILVILVPGPAEKKYSAPLMADVSKILYEAAGHNPIRTSAHCGTRVYCDSY
jgi:beta-lactamase class A